VYRSDSLESESEGCAAVDRVARRLIAIAQLDMTDSTRG